MEQDILFTLDDDGGTPWEDVPQKKLRSRDPIWDALVQLYGEPTNDNERGRMNKATKLIRQSLATEGLSYDEVNQIVRQRGFKMTTVWPGITPTALALANNWTTLKPPVRRICKNEKAGWDEEERRFVRATPEQLSAWKKALDGRTP